MSVRLLFCLVLALAASCGCGSQLGLGRATTMPAGQTRGSVGLDLDLLSPRQQEQSYVHLPWVLTRVGVHHGLTDRVELGARFWAFGLPRSLVTFGGALDTKIGIVRAEGPRDRVSIATGLSLGYHQPLYGGNAYHVFNATLPVLLGVRIARHELVFSPRIADYVIGSYGMNTLHSFYFGMGVGVALAVDPRFELMPEVVAMYSLLSFNGEADDDRRGVAMTQIGLGGRFEF